MSDAEAQRASRAAAAGRGKCSVCRKRPRREDARTCDVCANGAQDSERRIEGLARQRLWNECCQSTDRHRFDCTAYEGKRGKGPFLPTSAPTLAELVARLVVAS